MVHGIRIHHPSHGLFARTHVRSRNVAFWPKPIGELGRIPASKALQLSSRHFAWIANDAALCSAERNINDGAFPRHPSCQSADFIERNVRRETNSTFARSANCGVKNTVAGEDFQRAAVHSHRDV